MVEEHFASGNPDRTILTLPLVAKDQALNQSLSEKGTEKGIKKSEEISKRLEAVLDLIRQEPTVSQKSIAEN